MNFTSSDIARSVDTATFARGEDYARRGKVLSLEWDAPDLLAEVSGSGGAVYYQSIRLHSVRNKVQVDGQCSCPMDYNCKHVVAALLASLASRAIIPDGQGALQSVGMGAVAEAWLKQAALLQPPVPASLAATPAHRLVYVLMCASAPGSPYLLQCMARLRKDGSIGAVTASTTASNTYGLLTTPPAWIRPDDDALLRLFASLSAGSRYTTDIVPVGSSGASLLERACAERRLLQAMSFDDLKRGRVHTLVAGPRRQAALAWHMQALANGGAAFRLCWDFADAGGEPIEHVLPTAPPYYLSGGALGELALSAPLDGVAPRALVDLVRQAPPVMPEQGAVMAERLAALGLDRLFPAPRVMPQRERRGIVPTPHLVLDSMPDDATGVLVWHDYAMLYFDYDGVSTRDVDTPQLRVVQDGSIDLIARDLDAESAAAARLARIGFAAPPDDAVLAEGAPVMVLPSVADWVDFARRELPRLRADGWRIEIEDDYRFDARDPDEWYAELSEEGEGNAWFALELGIVVDGVRHALLPILVEMLRAMPRGVDVADLVDDAPAGQLVVELVDGTQVFLESARIAPIMATLRELHFGDRVGKAIRLPYADAARLAELERAAQLRWVGGERLRDIGRKLSAFDGIPPATPPAGLQAELRPYQRSGLAWLQFLREYGFGGILADDMGLGKTVQTLAHILLEKEAGRLDRPALVVAPTSLMPNWQAEAARFAPGLRVLLLHGKDRGALFDRIDGADLVLTTYALLPRDEDALRAHRYHLLILDEAQYIKNSRSKASQTARLLDARHRLCLTGTPVQNHLGELWSQFHFLMPGLLGDDKTFNAAYRKPIEQGGDASRKDLLVRRIKPFMLRRTKDKVATELPPKTEIVLPVELGGAQRDLYETVRVAMDRKVRDEIDRKGLARSHILILDALLKLRQVCCDPRLVKRDGAPVAAPSAKLEALLALLDTLHSEGRRVLVFSQFTSMLALIGDELRARERNYVVLTGDTLDRAAPVAAFQEGQVGVFLISLKAGGVGLNLTAADTVIHYDPWWNPATENQATDRAWRIGQDQPVFVYKLIARGTLEEKIQEMQGRKAELANAVLTSETELAPGIGADDLRDIFALSPA